MNDTNSQNSTTRIPEFSSKLEEATWWETHELTDYTDELRPVEGKDARNLSAVLHVRLDMRTLEELRGQAEETGVGTTTLARMLIKEQLRAKRGTINAASSGGRRAVLIVPNRRGRSERLSMFLALKRLE